MTTQEGIKRAAEKAADMPVVHRATTAVVETFRGEVVWQGAVTEFWGRDCFVYAWAVEGDKEPRYVTVLGGGKIDSPVAAVRAWIVSQAQAKKQMEGT